MALQSGANHGKRLGLERVPSVAACHTMRGELGDCVNSLVTHGGGRFMSKSEEEETLERAQCLMRQVVVQGHPECWCMWHSGVVGGGLDIGGRCAEEETAEENEREGAHLQSVRLYIWDGESARTTSVSAVIANWARASR